MNKIKLLISFLIMLLLIGCSTSIGYLNDGIEKYAPTSASNVQVFSEKFQDKDYVEIGFVAAHMLSDVTGDGLKNILKEKAAEIGADAIIEFRLWGANDGALAEGIAIKYLN